MDKKLFACLVALISLTFCLVSFAEEKSDNSDTSDVIILGTKNFTENIDPEILYLVEFYAPWCGHCQALAPEYEEAATILKEDNIKLVKVDCTSETELCHEYEIRGYPTLKVLKGGNVMEYNGGRKADLIVSYMRKQALPAVSDVTVENFDSFKDSDNIVIIGFWNIDNQKEHDIFVEVAEKLRNDYLFGQTGQKEAAEKAGVTAPAVVIYSKLEGGNVEIFNGTFEKEQLINFIKVYSVPILGEIGPDNYSFYVDSGLPIAFLFYENEEQRTLLKTSVDPILQKVKGHLTFGYIDATKYGAHAENINLKEKWPAVGIQKLIQDGDFQKFPFDQSKDITPESIEEFITAFVEGKILPDVKSEPIPENNDGPVFILVANNFEEVVYDKSKDVLIEFYAPWCGHCKKLAPIYDQLGTLYKDYKDKIVIAKIDATENDLPPIVPFKIGGFPTIKLFRSGDNEVVDYSGDRSLDSFVEFLKQSAGNKVDVVVKVPSDTESSESPSPPAESETSEEHDEL